MQVTLIAVGGRQAGARIPVRVNEFAIGSAATCQLKLRGNAFPDRICKLRLSSDEVWIERESEAVELKRNSEIITSRVKLADSDTITIGPMSFVIRLEAIESTKPRLPRQISDDEICQWLEEAGMSEQSKAASISVRQ
jgi:hypothetical protein